MRAGLDSFAALNVMEHMAHLAIQGHAIIATIHQPRAAIWAMFHKVLRPCAAACFATPSRACRSQNWPIWSCAVQGTLKWACLGLDIRLHACNGPCHFQSGSVRLNVCGSCCELQGTVLLLQVNVLSEGYQMYFGSPGRAAEWFNSLGWVSIAQGIRTADS